MAYLIGRAFHWFGGRVNTRARRTPVYLDDQTLRDIGLTRMEYHFLHMSDPASAHDAGGADQADFVGCWCSLDIGHFLNLFNGCGVRSDSNLYSAPRQSLLGE
jgi:hypothetical protein